MDDLKDNLKNEVDEKPLKEWNLDKGWHASQACPHCKHPVVLNNNDLRNVFFCGRCHRKIVF